MSINRHVLPRHTLTQSKQSKKEKKETNHGAFVFLFNAQSR